MYCLISVISCERLVDVPTNIALKVDSLSNFNCNRSTENLKARIQWYYQAPGSNLQQLLYNGFEFNTSFDSRYDVNKSIPGRCDLYIARTQPTDAGTYSCSRTGTTSAKSAQLVVLGMFAYFNRGIINMINVEMVIIPEDVYNYEKHIPSL